MNKSLQDAIIKAKQDPNGLSDADLEFIYEQGREDAIKDLPKCKDCLHWKLLNVTKSHICDVFNWMSNVDDYCSFAEVKEKQNG